MQQQLVPPPPDADCCWVRPLQWKTSVVINWALHQGVQINCCPMSVLMCEPNPSVSPLLAAQAPIPAHTQQYRGEELVQVWIQAASMQPPPRGLTNRIEGFPTCTKATSCCWELPCFRLKLLLLLFRAGRIGFGTASLYAKTRVITFLDVTVALMAAGRRDWPFVGG
jgi:hypothetical protein